MDRSNDWVKKIIIRKWFIIILNVVLMSINILLAAMSEDIATRFTNNAGDDRDTLRIDIILCASFTQLISSIGIIGAYRENYRQIKYFILFNAANTVFSLHISIKAFGLSFLTILNIMVLYFAAKYGRSLKRKMQDNNRIAFTNDANNNNNQISVISLPDNIEQSLPPPQYEPPPPYSEELTKLPKIA